VPICNIAQRLPLCCHIIRPDASKQHEPGPLIVGIFKPTHIGHVLIIARQATLDRFPSGGSDPFRHCGKWHCVIPLGITEHLDRNQTITIRLLREQRSIAKDYQTTDTVRYVNPCAGTEVVCEELLLFYSCGAIA